MIECGVCLDLNWDVFPAEKGLETRSLRVKSSDLDIGRDAGCRVCSILLEGISTLSPILQGPPGTALDFGRPYWMYLKYKRDFPLQLIGYVHLLDRARKRDGDFRTFKLELEFFTEHSRPTPWHAFGPSRIVTARLSAKRRRKFIRGWLQDCHNNHEACHVPADAKLPKRVLDLGRTPRKMIKLVESQGGRGQYATISHCWGDRLPLITTKDTLLEKQRGIYWAELPRSFQNAIITASEQRIRYLWIDSLCIIQDDPSDWAEHASSMSDIYAGSYLNIGLTRASDSHSGCFGERWCEQNGELAQRPWLCPVKVTRIKVDLAEIQYVVFARLQLNLAHQTFARDISSTQYPYQYDHFDLSVSAPLLTRAWVFQERFLATRMLHFHAAEMVWECNAVSRCECTGLDSLTQRDSTAALLKAVCAGVTTVDHATLMDLWRWVITEYTKLRLTNETDRLPALAGLASRFHFISGYTYLAGLLAEDDVDFTETLLWRIVKKPALNGPRTYRIAAPRPPTWSWASLSIGGMDLVNYDTVRLEEFQKSPDFEVLEVHYSNPGEVLEAHYSRPGDNPPGPVLLGKLEVRGLLILGVIFYEESADGGAITHVLPAAVNAFTRNVGLAQLYGPTPYSPSGIIDPDCDIWVEGPHCIPSGQFVYCLLLGKGQEDQDHGYNLGIALRRSSSSMPDFERIGWFHSAGENDLFKEAQVHTLTII